ncbi:LysR family transcriptional regulator [Saccharopolyspora sp. NPDC049357]|uniref:LysR family transcriptional regulator n=1 Tax=Saccharopolyspora sp. NPDC049357 TaxID=3154507 RepID=UPI003432D95B
MELRWLESFVAVVDHGGFQQAGVELGLSQPTVSSHIKDLEGSLGVLLVDRRTRPVRLTPAGSGFIRHARLILGEVDSGLQHLRRVAKPQTRGVVTIATYPSASAGYLPRLLSLARETYPEIEIVLEEMAGGEMESAADSGRFDVFLRQAEPPLSPRRFGMEFLWKEKFLIVVPRDHPWAEEPEKPLDPQKIVHARVIMTGRFQPETLLGHPLWRDLGGYPEVAHSVRHPQSLLALVESGAGIGLTTELPVAVSRNHDVVLRTIDHVSAVREVYVNWSLARALTDQANAIVALMRANPTPVPIAAEER